jgi:shikimate dehydrogenase
MDYSLIENKVNIAHLDKYAAIIGENPSNGARSPKLWNAVFEDNGLNFAMIPIDVKKNKILDLMDNLSNDNYFIGGAIAVPYKEVIAKWLGDSLTPEAQKIGAVNCLFRDENGKLKGTNTDGEASLISYINKFGPLESKSVLIMGIGGAGKAVSSYFSTNTKSTTIVSRSNKGKAFAKKINADWTDWSQMNNIINKIDIVINCTSIGFGDQELKSPLDDKQMLTLKASTIIFDIIYQPLETKLLKIAKNFGLSSLNGLDMNLEQAVLAYRYALKPINGIDHIRKIMSQA